ncbi:conserved hypothetical protein [Vibrio chagasii]|nr:conserved hypothetical protein [Vibrio chagasii]CAH7155194.1 conserved hypothetical protein [Vibrio chagasii]CAH7211211.1 conserved hypothetical protein [Vibrio chagasii]
MKQDIIVTIHQPESYPWYGFFNKMYNCDKYIILDSVDFRKNYFQNRNKILTNNGESYLTIPIRKGDSKKIKDIEIVSNSAWNKKHWQTILQSYKKSPYFHEIESELFKVISNGAEKLVEYNLNIISLFKDKLGFKCDLLLSSDLNIEAKSSDLILEICKATDATTYISGKDGANYLNEKDFNEESISVKFQNFKIEEYSQFNSNGNFVPYMSVIDLISNIGIEKTREYIIKGWSVK